MSNNYKLALTLLGTGLLAFSTASVVAQTQEQEAAPVPSQVSRLSADIQEITITARRREERIQDVPITVQAISGETLEELNLFDFSDLGKVTAGVSLSGAETGVTTIRGVSFNPTAQTNPSAAFYINEGPVQPTFATTMFDIGQYEILRGPQGTLRGQSAPTGAITITTRRPDLTQFGGMFMSTLTDADGRTFQGALNLPVIEDVFALRIAGITNRTNGGGVKSVNSSADPFSEAKTFRISALYEPLDNLSATVVYQKRTSDSLSFGGAVYGEGSPGGTFHQPANYALPITLQPGYNGPVLKPGQRRSIAEYGGRTGSNEHEFATAQINYSFAGHALSYVGAWTHTESTPGSSYADTGNHVTGDWPARNMTTDLTRWTHELRLSSEDRLFGLMDYTVGVFHLDEDNESLSNNGISFQRGAFGSPLGAPQPFSPNLDYSTTAFADRENYVEEWSYFGNVTFHLTDATELSAGIRFINAEKDALRVNSQTGGFRADVISEGDCLAAGGAFARTYAGVCDVPVAGRITGTIPEDSKNSTRVYSASLSHRFTQDLMAYVSYGTSWRPGPAQGQLINGANDPLLNSLIQLDDEKSKSIEMGVKSSWLDDRLIVNFAYYRQEYDNFVLSQLSGIPYLADTGVGPRMVSFAVPMNSNVDIKVDGVDLDVSFAATERWNINAGISWADSRYSNQLVPCIDGNFDGIPDAMLNFNPAAFDAAGVKIAMCQSSGRGSQIPKWNVSLRSDYTQPISGSIDGFIRGVLTHTPENPYANPLYKTPDYTLLDVNVGIRDSSAGWEIQLFARNLTNEKTITAIGLGDITQGQAQASLFGPAGYASVASLAPRELGLTFRYVFGSR